MKYIVSLASYPARIKAAHIACESLLRQRFKADVVILYLAEDEFPDREAGLPRELCALADMGLRIAWCQNLKSYKKLVPALREFPDSCIITFDDDLVYNPRLTEILADEHRRHPEDIIVHRITRLYRDGGGALDILPRTAYYDRKAKRPMYRAALRSPSYFNKLTGCAGCLYPPGALHKDVLDMETALRLAPTSDDIWFWLQGVRNHRRVRVAERHLPELNYIPGTQDVGLCHVNDSGEKLFFVHLNNILAQYPEIASIMDEDAAENERVVKDASGGVRRTVNVRKVIKCLLPYGLVRLIQKLRGF